MLTDVFYVPTLQINIFYVSLTAFKNVDTFYTKIGCQMLADGIVLMEGSLETILHKLHIRALLSPSHINVITPGFTLHHDEIFGVAACTNVITSKRFVKYLLIAPIPLYLK
jgi:hypothetical protein